MLDRMDLIVEGNGTQVIGAKRQVLKGPPRCLDSARPPFSATSAARTGLPSHRNYQGGS